MGVGVERVVPVRLGPTALPLSSSGSTSKVMDSPSQPTALPLPIPRPSFLKFPQQLDLAGAPVWLTRRVCQLSEVAKLLVSLGTRQK